MLSVSLSRGANPPLVIEAGPMVGLYLPEDAIGPIARRLQRTYGPSSAYVRAPLLAIVEEATAVPLTIYAKGTSATNLQEHRELLEAVVTQWRYQVTVPVDGVTTTYNAEPDLPVWELTHDSGAVREHIDRCRLLIPVKL